MPRKSLGTLSNLSGYATHNTRRTTARKFKNKHPLSIPGAPKGKENTKHVCTFHSQPKLISFKSELHSRNALGRVGRVINHYPTRRKLMSRQKHGPMLIMMPLPRCMNTWERFILQNLRMQLNWEVVDLDFHCEMNPLEMVWGRAKYHYRLYPPSKKEEVLEANVLNALDSVTIQEMRR